MADVELDSDGPAAPPRANGELVFAEQWERRVFGLTLALTRAAVFDFERFRLQLIARIAQDDRRRYWDSWAAALEDVLAATGTLSRAELDVRHTAYLARPPGHDHH